MANIAPILRIRARVRSVEPRTVDPVPAREASYDEAGNLLKQALPAREGYSVHDVMVDTDPGGLVSVVFRDEAVTEAGGFLPKVGDEIDVPVRAYDSWQDGRYGRYRTNGYSFAGTVYAAEIAAKPSGVRAAS